MITSLLHHSDFGGRHRHAAVAVAGPTFPLLRSVRARGLMLEGRCGMRALQHLRGLGGAAKLNSGASAGALRREVDDDCLPALRLPHGHFDDPFDLHVSVAIRDSDRRVAGAEEVFAVGESHV